MNAETTKYLLNQQRIEFNENWENELDGWATSWNDKFYQDIDGLKDVSQLINYLYRKIDKDRSTTEEHIYHNLMNQKKKDQKQMFEDIKERVDEILEEIRLYHNGEL